MDDKLTKLQSWLRLQLELAERDIANRERIIEKASLDGYSALASAEANTLQQERGWAGALALVKSYLTDL